MPELVPERNGTVRSTARNNKINAEGGTRTHMARDHWFLRPACIPIPPLRQEIIKKHKNIQMFVKRTMRSQSKLKYESF